MGKIFKALEKSKLEKSEGNIDLVHEPIAYEQKVDFQVSNNDILMAEQLVIPENIDKSLVAVLTPHSAEAEQFRLLKNNILFPETGTPPKSIMITSPSPNEGKS
ncbi:MAG: exopolysaccharide biosynthesis protein, partial [Proteobacteria bacterium]|nr:exopolysaccharide biosynthesis protein [Pseudomonadota bacterium]MBU1584785.1 exopolysaccharide biosynthesis protein [Pseudomonadota bacterium]